ncbi:hypothetical protein TPHA_0E00130 [Tetrapisispora phaffii CBS 4417]|uniref:Uncharacterized protein n=1 Tax=Tetrapisispora phaffii (strain ATCC 24235 / CBS 4417 / NBRC 1672 / NRRL Y-8282 / UCD 70-5) TaxID=1071381 RepID=G8BT82_TETPH|nr:hypothetical protein TPHA_0E00130 [Tetrapisispora phaffii CBS 4417]CCE63110.1 hypothetical protein TPHA_0E00130 [Tetrapisispora phaffii CBS 4417]
MLKITNKAITRNLLCLSSKRSIVFQATKLRSTISTVETEKIRKPITINDELPDPTEHQFRQRLGFVAFVLSVSSALGLLFNYEKTESPIVVNTIYYLRRSAKTREILGDNIEFDGLIPWVSGKLNQVQGKVNIKFHIKGSNNVVGTVRLVADRNNRDEEFLIHEWTLTVNGQKLDILSEIEGASI